MSASMEEPQPKKLKTEDNEEEAEPEKEAAAVAMEKNDQGDAFVELGKMKRLTVRTFKGNVLVDIREVNYHHRCRRPEEDLITTTMILVRDSSLMPSSLLRFARSTTKRMIKCFRERKVLV